jgi:radical SAM superfamily enzyme YgiQ (UPF0313 family)
MIHDGMLHRTSPLEFRKIVKSYQPDVVGITAQATPAIYDVYTTAQDVKEIDPSIHIVLGGAHATFLDTDILNDCPAVDFVIRGEGEMAMIDLLRGIEKGELNQVKSLTYRENGTIIRNPLRKPISDLDELPLPAYDLLNLEEYFKENVRLATIVSSRGCPFRCRFCSSSRVSGKKWRGRSAENVVSEIKFLVEKYNITDFEFLDDLFTYDPKRVERICELLKHSHLNIGWTCSVRADIITANPNLLKIMKDAGCRSVYMGVESGSSKILTEMKKGITISQIYQASNLIKSVGLGSVYSFILGYPGENEKDLNTTISFACRLDPDFAQFTICTPYPGTPLFEEAKRSGLITSDSWLDYSILGSVMQLPSLSHESLKHHLYKAYLRFYLRPSFLLRQIRGKNTFLLRKIVQGIKEYVQRRAQSKVVRKTAICDRDDMNEFQHSIMIDEVFKSPILSELEIQPIHK